MVDLQLNIEFQPLYNFSPISTAISSNKINVSFIPNFNFSFSDGQIVDYIVDGNLQSTLNINYDPNKALKYNEVVFPKSNDSTAIHFYLGIDLTSDISSSATALSIFGNSWTKCGWVSTICKTTGKFSKVSPTPSTVTESVTGAVRSIADEVSMLTSYLANDVTLGIKSSVNITLPSGSSFKFFIYSYNSDYTGANIVNSLPLFTIKINGKYQEPYSRPSSTYQQYKKYGPFFYNTDSTDSKLIIEWASDNIKYSIPICGIEIFSNSSSPLNIPTPTPSSGGAVETSSKTTTTTSGSTETNYDESLSVASSILSSKTIFNLIFFISLFFSLIV
ncbi:hypothetical protein ACTFIZ_008342 [Dictyostelium cf. discoideum]